MAQEVCVTVDAGDRARLAAIASDRNRPQKHAQRARFVLLSAGRLPASSAKYVMVCLCKKSWALFIPINNV
jgi:hypothetical protein